MVLNTFLISCKWVKLVIEHIATTAPKGRRALVASQDIGLSSEPCNHITQGEKRLRKAHGRRSRNGTVINEKNHACTVSSNDPKACVVRHPPPNANGIRNASWPLKRLVMVNINTTMETKVRNLTSEVEYEVRKKIRRQRRSSRMATKAHIIL